MEDQGLLGRCYRLPARRVSWLYYNKIFKRQV